MELKSDRKVLILFCFVLVFFQVELLNFVCSLKKKSISDQPPNLFIEKQKKKIVFLHIRHNSKIPSHPTIIELGLELRLGLGFGLGLGIRVKDQDQSSAQGIIEFFCILKLQILPIFFLYAFRFQYILPSILRVYTHHQSNPLVCTAIEVGISQYYHFILKFSIIATFLIINNLNNQQGTY